MIAFLGCLGVFAASVAGLYLASVRSLQAEVATLKRIVGAESIWNNGQHRLRRDEMKALRKLSGMELEAVSERLDKIETEDTALCKTI